jgi:hypothetical protein
MSLANPESLFKRKNHFDTNEEFIELVRNQLQFLVSYNGIITQELMDSCIGSIGPYVARTGTINWPEKKFEYKLKSLVDFWTECRLDFPDWFEFAKICYLYQPSSCAAERTFSILKYVLTTSHEECLDDYIKAAVCLRFDRLQIR